MFSGGRSFPTPFEYTDFSSTNGLNLVSTFQISSNQIYLTDKVDGDVGNVYRSTSDRWDSSFSVYWNFICTGGGGADGFCLQWTPTNNTNGDTGGSVSRITTAIHAITFRTYSNNDVRWFYNDSVQQDNSAVLKFRQNLYFWLDYSHEAKTCKIYTSTINTKPVNADYSYSNFVFDSGSYYIGFGAATGGTNDYHILKSWKVAWL